MHDVRRANYLLDNDFDAFVAVDPAVDPLFARPVPHEVLFDRYNNTHDPNKWRLFVARTVKRWNKFIRSSEFNSSERILLSQVVFDALNTDPEEWLPRKRARKSQLG